MWGWSIPEKEVFLLLDTFYQSGERYIDTAFNYPSNKNPEDLQLASKILSNWIKSHGVSDLKVIYKFGSIQNNNISDNNLSKNNIVKSLEIGQEQFRENLYSLMIHWDNRSHKNEILETLKDLKSISEANTISLGLSGIKHNEIYVPLLKQLGIDNFDLEVKSNFIQQNEKNMIDLISLSKKVWAYGISGSGLKLDKKSYRKDSYVSLVRHENYHDQIFENDLSNKISEFIDKHPFIENLYQFSMAFCEGNENLFGYIVSASSKPQMEQILNFRAALNTEAINLEEISHHAK